MSIAMPPARRVAVGDGVELSVAEAGTGPAVVLCHGFPELGFSWRHQIAPLAEAGHRVIVPDMRGYGASSAPPEIEEYDVLSLCGDMTGLLDALGEESAIFIGHDWGAFLVWQMAWIHPERVRAVAGLSVPFVPRAPAAPIPIMRANLGEEFYIVWFQTPGVADAALAGDVRRTLTTSRQWTAQWAEEDGASKKRPEWLSEEELQVYVDAFERTGFTGGLNWYRNIDRNWELTAPFQERRIEQPALFLTGELDLSRASCRSRRWTGGSPICAATSACPARATGSSSRRPRPSTQSCSASSRRSRQGGRPALRAGLSGSAGAPCRPLGVGRPPGQAA